MPKTKSLFAGPEELKALFNSEECVCVVLWKRPVEGKCYEITVTQQHRLEPRKPTWWDAIKGFFHCTFGL